MLGGFFDHLPYRLSLIYSDVTEHWSLQVQRTAAMTMFNANTHIVQQQGRREREEGLAD